MRAAGRKVHIVPKLSIEDGIAASRAIFGRCWFDADKCADGIQALRHYRYEMDLKLGSYKPEPLHDWASHPADGFRSIGVAIQEPEQQREALRMPSNPYGASGWMA
jgi:phage terminase large subunit